MAKDESLHDLRVFPKRLVKHRLPVEKDVARKHPGRGVRQSRRARQKPIAGESK